MGFVHVKVLVASPSNPHEEREIELLGDTGAILSVIPRSLLAELRIQPLEQRDFGTFNGVVHRDIGGLVIKYGGHVTVSQVIFGEEADTPVLDVTTLEILGYQVDSTTGELNPTELLLL